jgi:hypothetical protein
MSENLIENLREIISEAPVDFLGTGSSIRHAEKEESEWNRKIDEALLEIQKRMLSKEQVEAIMSVHFFLEMEQDDENEDEDDWKVQRLEEKFPELFSKRSGIIKEALQRGFVKGVIIDSSKVPHVSCGTGKWLYMLQHRTGFKYYQQSDLLAYGNNEATIYCNGVWADVKDKSQVRVSEVLNLV